MGIASAAGWPGPDTTTLKPFKGFQFQFCELWAIYGDLHVRIGVGIVVGVARGDRDNLGNAERIGKIILHIFLRNPRNPLFH